MKIISQFVLLLLCSVVVNAQTSVASITCRYKGVDAGTLSVILPVNNNYFYNVKEFPVSKEGSCTITLAKSQTGYVIVKGFNNTIKLFVQSGDKIVAEIDTALKKDNLKITGSNAAGQELLNNGVMPGDYYSLTSLYDKDTTVAAITAHAQQDKEKIQTSFGPLLQQKKINKGFYDFVKLNFEYAFVIAENDAFANKFYPTTYPPAHPHYKAAFPEDFAKAWDELYQKYPLTNPELTRVPSFEFLCERYLNSYYWYKKVSKGEAIKVKDQGDAARMRIQWAGEAFPGALSEHAQAVTFFDIYLQQRFENTLPQLFKEFQQKFPKSTYTAVLAPMNEKVIAYYKAAKRDFEGDEEVIKDYSNINSFAELVEKFKGKLFYIDMWATWCGPCKAEFEYKDALHDYMKQKGIAMLYISMDEDRSDEQWKEMIKYYGLSGYHVRTNDSLRNDLIKIFWKGKGYSIPRYVLVDAQGKIIEKNALRPSDKEALYKQISSHIE